MGKEPADSKLPNEIGLLKQDQSIRKNQHKSVLQKSKALQTSHSLLNTSKIQAVQCENNPLMDKLDTLISFCKELSSGQAEIRKKLIEMDQCLKSLSGRAHIEPIDNIHQTIDSSSFTKDMVEQAKTRLSLDIDVDLVYYGKNLLRHSFNYTNINTFGTTLLSELFKLRELNTGTVEPTKSSTPSLDQRRVDLIKVCYLKKLKSIEAFEHYWPSIVKSLRQKCIDVKSNIKKKGHLYNKLQEELLADGLIQTENLNDVYDDGDDYENFETKVENEDDQMEELGLV